MALLTGQPYADPLQPETDPARNRSMQDALNDFMNNLSGADRASLERVALMVVDVTTGVPPHVWAGHRQHEVHFSGSLLKVVAMYTAFDLLSSSKRQIIDRQPQSATDFFASLVSDFDPAILAATSNTIRNTPGMKPEFVVPSYRQVLEPVLDGAGVPVDVTFTAAFQAAMDAMITHSDTVGAGTCIHGLGFGLLNARLVDDGFFDNTTEQGIWLAGDYVQVRPPARISSVNDGPVAQATTAVDMARLYALMADGILVTVDDSIAMLGLLARAGSWMHHTTPPLWPHGGIDATRSKVGVGRLKPNPDGTFEQVVSEGLTATDQVRGLDFVVVWQNLKGAQSRANMAPVAHAIEATIHGLS